MTIQSKDYERVRLLREARPPGRLGILIEKLTDTSDGAVRVTWYGGLTAATVRGALDSIHAAALLGDRIVIDLRGLEILSSAGTEMLARAFEDGHRISVLVTDDGARRMPDLRELAKSLPVEVVKDMSPHPPHPIHDGWAQFPPGDYFLG